MPIFEEAKDLYRDKGFNIDDLSYKKWLNQNFKIGLSKSTEVLNVEYRDKNKDLILPLLNKISSTYKQYSGKAKIRELNAGISYLDNQIKIYEKKQLNHLGIYKIFL